MNTGITTAHSVVEPTPRTKRIAGTLIILYALDNDGAAGLDHCHQHQVAA